MTDVCTLPQPLIAYFTDKKVAGAVDSLVDKLDGSDMPEASCEEARAYNTALLAAAQVRTGFVEFLFEAWERTFGSAGASKLGEPYFQFDAYSPAGCWSEKGLALIYYRNGWLPEDEGPSDLLLVEVEKDRSLRLQVWRWTTDDVRLRFQDSPDLPLWESVHDREDKTDYQRTKAKLSLTAPDGRIDLAPLRDAAAEMVSFLTTS